MNRMILSVVSVSAVATALFAQAPIPGGFGGQEGRPAFGQGQGGQGLRGGAGNASVAASDRYVYVLRGSTLYQYSADGLKFVAKAELPAADARGGVDGAGRGQGGGRGNREAQPPVK